MYTRYQTWQETLFGSVISSGWENNINLGASCVDVRFMLKGYGWKDNASDQNIPILYAGRYECYYRVRFATEWIKFATVVSERAPTADATVYKDVFVELGVVPEAVYEIRIVAVDGDRFTGFGGVIEGITQGDTFWYDFQMRANRPHSINVFDNIKANEYAYGGKKVVELSVFDSVFYLEFIDAGQQYRITVYDTVSYSETVLRTINYALLIFDNVSVAEVFTTWTNWVNVATPYEVPAIQEVVTLVPNPLGVYPAEVIAVNEWAVMGVNPINLPTFIENIATTEQLIRIYTEPPWQVWQASDVLSLSEVTRLLPFVPIYFDPCDNLSTWVNQCTGTGTVTVEDNAFLFTPDGPSNVAQTKRPTGLSWGRIFFFEFDLQFVSNNPTSSGQIFLSFYGQKSMYFMTISQWFGDAEEISGSISCWSQTYATNLFDAKNKWTKLRFEVYQLSSNNYSMMKVYENGEYRGQLKAQGWSGMSPGDIVFYTYDYAGRWTKIDNIRIGNMEQANLVYIWEQDNMYASSTDVWVYDVVTLSKYSMPYGSIQQIQNVTVSESITLAPHLLFVDRIEWLTIQEYVNCIFVFPLPLVFDVVGTIEEYFVYDVVIPIQTPVDLVYVAENIATDKFMPIFYEPCDDFNSWELTQQGSYTMEISPAGNWHLAKDSGGTSDLYLRREVSTPWKQDIIELEFRIKIASGQYPIYFELDNGMVNWDLSFNYQSNPQSLGYINFGNLGAIYNCWFYDTWTTIKVRWTAPGGGLMTMDVWIDGVYKLHSTGGEGSSSRGAVVWTQVRCPAINGDTVSLYLDYIRVTSYSEFTQKQIGLLQYISSQEWRSLSVVAWDYGTVIGIQPINVTEYVYMGRSILDLAVFDEIGITEMMAYNDVIIGGVAETFSVTEAVQVMKMVGTNYIIENCANFTTNQWSTYNTPTYATLTADGQYHFWTGVYAYAMGRITAYTNVSTSFYPSPNGMFVFSMKYTIGAGNVGGLYGIVLGVQSGWWNSNRTGFEVNIQFKSDLSIVIGGVTVATNAFESGVWAEWKIIYVGGSNRSFVSLYRNGEFVAGGGYDVATPQSGSDLRLYQSAGSPVAQQWADIEFINWYDLQPTAWLYNRNSLDYDNITVAENVGVAVV